MIYERYTARVVVVVDVVEKVKESWTSPAYRRSGSSPSIAHPGRIKRLRFYKNGIFLWY